MAQFSTGGVAQFSTGGDNARVARMLGENEALLEDIALMRMDPEDGRLTIIDLDDEVSTTAFTPFGVENLKELLADLKPGEIPK